MKYLTRIAERSVPVEIKFRKKAKLEWTVLFILLMPFLFPLLTEMLPLPDFITYSLDIAWVSLLVGMLNKKRHFITPPVKKLLNICGIFFALTLIGFLLNFQSVFYYLWGLRNNIRFFVYFFACVFFVAVEGIESYLKFFDVVFWVNVPVMLFQFFVLDIKQDYLGGIFGTHKGCNGYTNVLFVIVAVKTLLYCLNNRETLSRCFLKCAVAIFLSALAELKSFYFEFVVIVAMAMCFTKSSYKKFWITIGSVAGVVVGIRILETIFPVFADWFAIDRVWETLTSSKGYTSRNDMNRLTAVSIALERFLPEFYHKLFGLGLGNCDYAGFEFLTTPFYKAYNGLNYMWFSSAFLILETGLVGMGLYIYFFVRIFLSAWKMSREGRGNALYCQMCMICAVMCGFLFVLNASLRAESGFMMFFVLALPFIRSENRLSSASLDRMNPTLKNVSE